MNDDAVRLARSHWPAIRCWRLAAALAALPLAGTLHAQATTTAGVYADTLRLPARTAADTAALLLIEATLVNPDSVPLRRLARVGEQWREVAGPEDWPEETEWSFSLHAPPDGSGPRWAVVAPTSQSGDWAVVDEYWFDAAGATVRSVHAYSRFGSACDVPLAHETITFWFRPDGRLLAKDYRLVSGEGGALDPSRCRPPFHDGFEVAPSLAALRARHGLTDR